MKAYLYQEVYKIEGENGREAMITFTEGKFDRCNYNLTGTYNLEDWKFLGEVAQEIQRLVSEKK